MDMATLMQMATRADLLRDVWAVRAGHAWVTFEYQGKNLHRRWHASPPWDELATPPDTQVIPIYQWNGTGRTSSFIRMGRQRPQIGFIQLVFNWPEWVSLLDDLLTEISTGCHGLLFAT